VNDMSNTRYIELWLSEDESWGVVETDMDDAKIKEVWDLYIKYKKENENEDEVFYIQCDTEEDSLGFEEWFKRYGIFNIIVTSDVVVFDCDGISNYSCLHSRNY